MIPAYFIFVGIFFSLLGSLGYIIATLRGETKPNRVTWFMWMVIGFIAFAAEISGGVGFSSWAILPAGGVPVIVLAASYINKNAYWELTRLDYICGALSLSGLVSWYLTRNQDYAIAFSIFSEFFAAAPTVRKAWIAPDTEKGSSYFFFVINNICAVLSAKEPSFTSLAYPGFLFLVNATMCFTVWRSRLFSFLSQKAS
jgi:hypothetical protein